MKIYIQIACLLVIILYSCMSPFYQFYFDLTGGNDIRKNPNLEIVNVEPKLFRGNNQEEDTQKMLENGYILIGYSSFNAGNVSENGAIYQAKNVHASIVILYSKYTNTVSGVLPLTLPDRKTSTTNVQGNVYGSGGSATYSGTATTTTRGTKTTYIPYNVQRSDYLATYWIKNKNIILGLRVVSLTNELRREIGSNKGLLIQAVIIGSPAYRADLFSGDILKKIGNIDMYDFESFDKALDQYKGKTVDLVIFRNGEEIIKTVTLNSID